MAEQPTTIDAPVCTDTVTERIVEVPGPERIVEVPGEIQHVVEYIEVPGPERIVENTILVPQVEVVDRNRPTDGAIGRGVRICVYGDGFTGIFVDDFGIVGGGCRDFPAGVYDTVSPVEHHTVRITR